MQATLSIHLTKVSLFPSSCTIVPLCLHSLYFLSLEMQTPMQHFIRDSFPQPVLPTEHSFSSIDTHLSLAYVQKVINGKKNQSAPLSSSRRPQMHIPSFWWRPSDVIVHPNHICPSSFFMHACSHHDKNRTFHMMSCSTDTLKEASGEHHGTRQQRTDTASLNYFSHPNAASQP